MALKSIYEICVSAGFFVLISIWNFLFLLKGLEVLYDDNLITSFI